MSHASRVQAIVANLEMLQESMSICNLMENFTGGYDDNGQKIPPTPLGRTIGVFQKELDAKLAAIEREEIARFLPTLSSEQFDELEALMTIEYHTQRDVLRDGIQRQLETALQQGTLLSVLHAFLARERPSDEQQTAIESKLRELCRGLHGAIEDDLAHELDAAFRIRLFISLLDLESAQSFRNFLTEQLVV